MRFNNSSYQEQIYINLWVESRRARSTRRWVVCILNDYSKATDSPRLKKEEVKKLLDQYVVDVPTERALADMKPVYLDPNIEIPPKDKTINKKSKRLNARQRRELGIYDIPKEALKYENFVPLHDLWLGYIKELYDQGQDIKVFAQKLLKADFHGAIFTVKKSINPVVVGITGIVIQETQNMFNIITKDNKLKSEFGII